jgi:hypothetical protein
VAQATGVLTKAEEQGQTSYKSNEQNAPGLLMAAVVAVAGLGKCPM